MTPTTTLQIALKLASSFKIFYLNLYRSASVIMQHLTLKKIIRVKAKSSPHFHDTFTLQGLIFEQAFTLEKCVNIPLVYLPKISA